MLSFTLEPQDNGRLQSLCGAFDDHLKLIEKEFNLTISRNNFTFHLTSTAKEPQSFHEKLIKSAAKLIQDLYVETAPIKGKVKDLDLEDVHIALQESRMLSQASTERAESKVYSTTIKTNPIFAQYLNARYQLWYWPCRYRKNLFSRSGSGGGTRTSRNSPYLTHPPCR